MTVADSNGSVYTRYRNRPQMGAACGFVWKRRLGATSEADHPDRCQPRTKTPWDATGELVLMRKRLTSGIEASPSKRRPVDRVALRVVQPGIHYTPKGLKTLVKELGGQAEAPPGANMPRELDDLTGAIIGQFVVIRYIGSHAHRGARLRHSRWLVRCSCGAYEHRNGPSLRKLALAADHVADRCSECQNIRLLRGDQPQVPPNEWQREPIPASPLLPGANDVFTGGEKFGHLTVIGYGGSNGKHGKWIVRCDCGAYGRVGSSGLKRGKSTQCDGCYQAGLEVQP